MKHGQAGKLTFGKRPFYPGDSVRSDRIVDDDQSPVGLWMMNGEHLDGPLSKSASTYGGEADDSEGVRHGASLRAAALLMRPGDRCPNCDEMSGKRRRNPDFLSSIRHSTWLNVAQRPANVLASLASLTPLASLAPLTDLGGATRRASALGEEPVAVTPTWLDGPSTTPPNW